ncbi:MAG TPA: GNAT family N-acetyltransferase [Caulobacteraceae bacterium]|jgi:GNAT superfamily N-acetyltransferase
MSDPILVREIRPEDRDRWTPLWDGYNSFYGRSGPTALDRAITDTTWSRFFNPEEPVFSFVAEARGELLGLVHYLFHRSTTQIAPTCYLQDLFARQDERGRGVGAALIEAVYAAAKAKGCARVYWQTHETNGIARALYDRIGERSGFIVYAKTL